MPLPARAELLMGLLMAFAAFCTPRGSQTVPNRLAQALVNKPFLATNAPQPQPQADGMWLVALRSMWLAP